MSGFSHSGHSHSGHSHSGHGMDLYAGLDAYSGFAATGLLADGMLHNREANVTTMTAGLPALPAPSGTAVYRGWMHTQFPAPDQPEHMARWAPHIRRHLFDFMLLSSVKFSVQTKTFPGGLTEDSGALHDTSDGTPLRIVELLRPSITAFGAQVDQVMVHAKLRKDRAAEILTQVVPPMAYFTSIIGLSPERTRHTMELVVHAQRFAMLVLMRFKHAFACPRPSEYSPLVQPLIDTPPFSALPSGHATECYMFTGVMRRLAPNATELIQKLETLSERIATNRVVAGLHFPIDNIAGRMLGETLAEYFVFTCAGSAAVGGWVDRSFDGASLSGAETFRPADVMDGPAVDLNGPFRRNKSAPTRQSAQGGANPLGTWLWGQARLEMDALGLG
jgi:hypothetical protein